MAEKRQRSGFFRAMVDFPAWMGLDSIKAAGSGITDTFNSLKKASLPKRVETFEEAMIRLSLDEAALKKRRRECYYSSWFYMACAVLLLVYGFHLLLNGHYLSPLIAAILAAISLVSSYREGFWYFQMTVRKLGCSHKEFVAFITGRK